MESLDYEGSKLFLWLLLSREGVGMMMGLADGDASSMWVYSLAILNVY